MEQHGESSYESNDPECIFLTIRAEGFERTFAMSRDDDRVVAVGSSTSADIQFERPGVSPIHFYFERSGSKIWIVPAYCISELRVNAAKISSPRRLGRRSLIEFGKTRLTAEMSEAPRAMATAALESSHGALSAKNRSSYLSQLPEQDAPTRQAWDGADSASEAALESGTITLVLRSRDSASPAPESSDEFTECSQSSSAKTVKLPPYVAERASIDATRRVDVSCPPQIDELSVEVREIVELDATQQDNFGNHAIRARRALFALERTRPMRGGEPTQKRNVHSAANSNAVRQPANSRLAIPPKRLSNPTGSAHQALPRSGMHCSNHTCANRIGGCCNRHEVHDY